MNIHISNSNPDGTTTTTTTTGQDTEEDYTEFQKYIIKNNIQLTNENKQLRLRINELEKENSSIENEVDKYDERIRYMRGLLQNIVEVKEKTNIVQEEWKKYCKNYNKLFNKYTTIEKYIDKVFKCYMVILFLICSVDNFFFGTYYYLCKILIYNSLCLSLMYIMINKNYILNNDIFKFKWKKNKLNLEFVEDISKIHIVQSELIKSTNEKIKEINELEKACVGVSVMIDNV